MLVPDDLGVRVLSEVEGVTPVRYTAGEPLPPEAVEARVLVPRFLAGVDPEAFFADLPRLEYIQLLSAGAENFVGVIPDGVVLSTCRGAHGGSTAEWVVGALLSVYRDLPAFDRSRIEGRWDYRGTETLQGKDVLVVGAGDLAVELRRRVEPFDATVTLVGRTARDGVHGFDELPDLLGRFDVVALVVPLTSETTGMVDAAFLERMRDGAILVNAARGRVVDTDALVAELVSGRLRAALDVTDPEPLPEGHPLWSAPGLFLTPHVAGSCTGTMERAYAVVAAEIARFARGEQPNNLVRGEY